MMRRSLEFLGIIQKEYRKSGDVRPHESSVSRSLSNDTVIKYASADGSAMVRLFY